MQNLGLPGGPLLGGLAPALRAPAGSAFADLDAVDVDGLLGKLFIYIFSKFLLHI